MYCKGQACNHPVEHSRQFPLHHEDENTCMFDIPSCSLLLSSASTSTFVHCGNCNSFPHYDDMLVSSKYRFLVVYPSRLFATQLCYCRQGIVTFSGKDRISLTLLRNSAVVKASLPFNGMTEYPFPGYSIHSVGREPRAAC